MELDLYEGFKSVAQEDERQIQAVLEDAMRAMLYSAIAFLQLQLAESKKTAKHGTKSTANRITHTGTSHL